MLIKESTLRRIIKEEARRVLREAAAAVPNVPGTSGQTTYAGWEGLSTSMTSLSQQVAQAGMATLATKIKDLAAKGRNSTSAAAALVAATVKPDGTATDAAKKEGLDQLAATLATLATGKSSLSYLSAAMTLVGGAPTVNTVDQTFTPVLRTIMKNLSQQGYRVGTIRSNLATIAATAPAPAGSAAPTPGAAPAPAAAPVASQTLVKNLSGKYVYTVVGGDTISGIASKVYNPPVPLSQKSSSIYNEIAAASKIAMNSTLVIGQILNLPLTVGGEKHRLKGF